MLSIIIPFYNEAESLPLLYEELTKELGTLHKDYEIILVNDGSTDNSAEISTSLAKKDRRIKIINQKKRFGKGEALSAGVHYSKGSVLAFMDADLQDNPADIGTFLKKMEADDLDLVNGVRTSRNHNSLIQIYSRLGNKIIQLLAQSPFQDINCPFKVIKRSVFEEIVLYGNNFRFLPLAAYYRGIAVGEIEVENRERKYGISKFGSGKVFIGLLDTITAYFLYKFSENPLHFFGIIGGVLSAIGLVIVGYYLVERVFFDVLLYRRPGFQFAMFLTIVGIQIIMTGFIGELIVYVNKSKESK